MSAKRKNGDVSDPLSGREKKKLKTAAARTIAVQQDDKVPSGSHAQPQGQGNNSGGPSRAVRFEAQQLPGSLDVEKFAEARSFEINAMHNAMQTARGDATHRAWQQLPRHLRRRAASHDARRVPLRLRDKAKAEIEPARKTRAQKQALRKRLAKQKHVSRAHALVKRQLDKVWLETHIWHAKRMKMENMWGYRLAIQPTEKAFRPSHRASVHGSILHDASYYGFVEVKGPEKIISWIFQSCCDMQGPSPSAKRFVSGARACDTHIHNPETYPYDLIGPVTIIWQALSTKETILKQQPTSSKEKSSGKAKQTASSGPDRVVWIRAHPTIFDEALLALRLSASFALERVKVDFDAPDTEKCNVEIADLRDCLNIFEITGPKSSQVIKGALKPVKNDRRNDFKEFWESLSHLQTTASVPRNLIAGFKVYDPRLSFPPHNAKVHVHGDGPTLSPNPTVLPTPTLAQCEIWDEKLREGLRNPHYKKKDLDSRRSKASIPGTPLQAQQDDDRIPIMLIQRSLESASWGSQHRGPTSPSLHGWTLIIPAGWSMAFLPSLIFTGTRVAGQRERQTQHFEAGCPHFPRDYPCTFAYGEFSADREVEERTRWERKPPAKRPNYTKLGTRSPWKPDWEVVLGIRAEGDADGTEASGDYIPAQREEPSEDEQQVQPWLLRGVEVNEVLNAAYGAGDHGAGLLAFINRLRAKRNQNPLDGASTKEKLLQGALVTVKVKMCGKGRPDDQALIYWVDDKEHNKWRKTKNDNEDDGSEHTDLIPPTTDIIGYITTANYSLSLGEGSALGFIPVTQLFRLKQQASRLRAESQLLVKIRDRDGVVCRAASLQVITT